MIRTGLVSGGLACCILSVAVAQDGGQRLTGTLRQGVEADTNFDLDPVSPGTTGRSTTALGISYLTETRTQSFQLSGDTSLRVLYGPDGETEFTLPSLTARYTRTSARAQFEAGSQFRQDPVSFLRPAELEFDDESNPLPPSNLDDIKGTGTRFRYGADTAVTLGIGGPREWRTSLGFTRTEFDAAAPNLNDTERFVADTAVRLRFSPVLDGVLSAQASFFSADDTEQTERDRYTLRAGVDYAINPRLSSNAGVGYSILDTTESGVTTQSDGIAADLGLTYQLPNTRLNTSLGVENTADDEIIFTGVVSLRATLPDGTITAGLNRSLSFGDDGEQVAETAARLRYSHPINSVSSANLGLTYSLREDLDVATVDNITRISFSTGYERTLTRRANLSLGYAYRLRDEGADEAESHSVSMNIVVPFDF